MFRLKLFLRVFPAVLRSVSLSPSCLNVPDSDLPACLFSRNSPLNVFGRPFEKTNIYSNCCSYRLCVNGIGFFFAYIIVSCSRNPSSINRKACRKLVPVSLPFTVASPTTHTTTPPSLVIRYHSFAVHSKSHSNPLYARKLS